MDHKCTNDFETGVGIRTLWYERVVRAVNLLVFSNLMNIFQYIYFWNMLIWLEKSLTWKDRQLSPSSHLWLQSTGLKSGFPKFASGFYRIKTKSVVWNSTSACIHSLLKRMACERNGYNSEIVINIDISNRI